MCGMCGYVDKGSLFSVDQAVFNKLMYVNLFKGSDATGIVRINSDRTFSYMKDILPVYDFMSLKEVDDFMELYKRSGSKHLNNNYVLKGIRGFMGHTRHGTKGKNSLANAHPFAYEDFIGMHNGTIEWENLKEGDSDSQQLFDLIEESEAKTFSGKIHDALKKTENITAAYALQIYNNKTDTLYFIRNSERPLHFTYVDGVSGLIWSSAADDLQYILNKSSKKNKVISNEEFQQHITVKGNIFELKPNVLFTVNVKKWTVNFEYLDIKKKINPVRNGNWVYNGTNYNVSNNNNNHSTHNYLFVNNKHGVFVNGEEARKIKEEGCLMCSSKTFRCNINTPVTWLPDDTYVCHECMNIENMDQYVTEAWAEAGKEINKGA